MPCFCWISDSEIEPELREIRKHAIEIVKLGKLIHDKGDLYPSAKSSPCPRSPMEDIHKLLDDLWSGKCQEHEE